MADKGYSYSSVRAELRRRGVGVVIPTRADQPRLSGFDKVAYRDRNRVERSVGRLKQFRRIAPATTGSRSTAWRGSSSTSF
ncbi:MAG TPA: transposase [Actinomycetes bacterium]|nr:transposase [Actinomycetes bacterium]